MIQFDEHILSDGWFNHQPENTRNVIIWIAHPTQCDQGVGDIHFSQVFEYF